MTVRLVAVSVAATDPAGLAQFWAGVLGWEMADQTLTPRDGTGFEIRFRLSAAPKLAANTIHLDLTSTTDAAQDETVARALGLGARHLDIGQRPDEGHIVLADPEGNEFCVIGAGNNFLAGCPFLGAVVCDGTRQVGYFWNRALGWPLVWDQDQETAIRSPHGGPKLTWGGTVPQAAGQGRLRFELESNDPLDRDRLLELGATLADGAWADPDGNEFRLTIRW